MAIENYIWEDEKGRNCYSAEAYDVAGTSRCEDFLCFEMDENNIYWRYHILDIHAITAATAKVSSASKAIKNSEKDYIPGHLLKFTSGIGNEIPVLTFTVKVSLHTGKRRISYERAKVKLEQIRSRFEVNCELYANQETRLRQIIVKDIKYSHLLQEQPWRVAEALQSGLKREVEGYVTRKFSESDSRPIWTTLVNKKFEHLKTKPNTDIVSFCSISAPARSAVGYYNSLLFIEMSSGDKSLSRNCGPYIEWNNIFQSRARREKKSFAAASDEDLDCLLKEGKQSEVYTKIGADNSSAKRLFDLLVQREFEEGGERSIVIGKTRIYKIKDDTYLVQVNILTRDGEIYRTMPTVLINSSSSAALNIAAQHFWELYLEDREFKDYGWKHRSFEGCVKKIISTKGAGFTEKLSGEREVPSQPQL